MRRYLIKKRSEATELECYQAEFLKISQKYLQVSKSAVNHGCYFHVKIKTTTYSNSSKLLAETKNLQNIEKKNIPCIKEVNCKKK